MQLIFLCLPSLQDLDFSSLANQGSPELKFLPLQPHDNAKRSAVVSANDQREKNIFSPLCGSLLSQVLITWVPLPWLSSETMLAQ